MFGCASDEQFEEELGIGDCEIIDDELVYGSQIGEEFYGSLGDDE